MNRRIVFAIAKKDIREASQNKSVWLPIMIVPIIFILLMPLGILLAANNADALASMSADPDLIRMMEKIPTFLSDLTAGLNESQSMIVLMLGYFYAPFFLILPIMYSTVIAAESFAGERERKTIEALLYTPASDAELFLGKVLAGAIPAVAITWISFVGYCVILNAGAYSIMDKIWFPLTTWYPLIFWVSPALSLLGIAATVLISSKTQTFMGAYQTSASLVVLVLALVVGQATGILYLSVTTGLLVGLVFWLVDIVLVWLAIRSFNREKLLASEK